MDFQYKVKRRRRLFERQNGRCYYCGCEMVWLSPFPSVGPWLDAMCTLEHLRDRNDPARRDPKSFEAEERTVAACYRCNHERGKERGRDAQLSRNVTPQPQAFPECDAAE